MGAETEDERIFGGSGAVMRRSTRTSSHPLGQFDVNTPFNYSSPVSGVSTEPLGTKNILDNQ